MLSKPMGVYPLVFGTMPDLKKYKKRPMLMLMLMLMSVHTVAGVIGLELTSVMSQVRRAGGGTATCRRPASARRRAWP